MRPLRASAAASAALLLAVATAEVGCGKERPLVAAGGACDLAADCVAGLVCVPLEDGRRVCSNDLSGIGGEPPPAGGEDPVDGGGAPEGGEPDTDASEPSPDASPPDDAGDIVDAGGD